MDLKDFVRDSIVSIVDAIAEAQQSVAAKGAFLNPADRTMNVKDQQVIEVDPETSARANVEQLEFDVAVTTSSTTTAQGVGGIKVVVAEVGGSTEDRSSDERVSRIRFSIPIVYPPMVSRELNAAREKVARERHEKDEASRAARARKGPKYG